jgi:hypothetical protein
MKIYAHLSIVSMGNDLCYKINPNKNIMIKNKFMKM